MPPQQRRLRVGDVVSVGCWRYGEQYATDKHGSAAWNARTKENYRDEGTISGRVGDKWEVTFSDDDSKFTYEKRALVWVRSTGVPEAGSGVTRGTALAADSSENEESPPPEAPVVDSSGDEMPQDLAQDLPAHAGDWTRDDTAPVDQRAKAGFTDQPGPKLRNASDFAVWTAASLFALGKLFLPVVFLVAMAAEMTAVGNDKAKNGLRHFVNWSVSVDDVYQWIGVWMYMLAFPQTGDRRAFFKPPPGGFGPRHNIPAILLLGDNGIKGCEWFEKMHSCFKLPAYPERTHPKDPFKKTRRFWDTLLAAFYLAVTASWLLVLDESMIRWMGRGMPGLMVVLRKPTPIGLELHTLCCALCGCLVGYEVYEGKIRMEAKEFYQKPVGGKYAPGKYPKSVALTLRMLKPWFGKVRT